MIPVGTLISLVVEKLPPMTGIVELWSEDKIILSDMTTSSKYIIIKPNVLLIKIPNNNHKMNVDSNYEEYEKVINEDPSKERLKKLASLKIKMNQKEKERISKFLKLDY